MSSIGIDASLAILRQELERMQKQDKALYTQLLTLQESIRGLKTELKKEREQCEEAFKDLEQISGHEFEDDVFVEGTEQNLSETTGEKNENASEEVWKHDRQDSGISVKTPDADTQDISTTPTSKHNTQELDFLKSSTSSPGSKPELISHGKQDLDPHLKTSNVEIPQRKTSNAKPVIIQHSKQDSGILIDEDAVRDTKLLSRLVESSEMFEKLENRKIDRIIQQKWMKVRENSLGNRSTLYQHQRSRSSNDLLLKNQPQRSLQHQYSTPGLLPRHSHTNSCPQTTLKQFTAQGKENQSSKQFNQNDTQLTAQGKEHQSVEKAPFRQFSDSDKVKILATHSRTNSCPQTLLNQFTGTELQTHEKQPFKQPNELNKAIYSVEKAPFQQFSEQGTLNDLKNDGKQSFKQFNGLNKELKTSEKLLNSSREDKSSSENYRRSFTPSERTALSLALNPVGASLAPKSVLKQNVIPKHHHTRSLPSTPERGLIVAENMLSRQENRRSMQNISEFKVVPAQQIRPRKRSASFVDLHSLGQCNDSSKENNLRGVSQDKDSPSESNQAPKKASVSQVDNLKQVRKDSNYKGKNSPKETFTVPHKANIKQVDSLKQAIQNGSRQSNVSHTENTRPSHKTVQIYSSNQARGSSHDQDKDSPKENTLTPHKTSVIRVNSLPQATDNILTQNKARVVHINSPKPAQGSNLTQNHVNENGELTMKVTTPLRAVMVSAKEVNVSNITDKQTLSRRCSLDERETGNHRPNEGPQPKFTITNFKTDRPRPRPEHGKLSPRFVTPNHSRNHIRHHTTPEYDVMRRRHSMYTFHAPSKSWDGYARKTTEVTKGIVRSASQVSLV